MFPSLTLLHVSCVSCRLAEQSREHIDNEHEYRSDIDRSRKERDKANSKLNTMQEQMTKLKEKETLSFIERKQLENRIQGLEDQISEDRLRKLR